MAYMAKAIDESYEGAVALSYQPDVWLDSFDSLNHFL